LLHYEIAALIGEGGMGKVYKARDTRLGRDVALKVLPDRLLADETFRSRFAREAQLLAALQHPHIATIHGLEEDGNHRFLVLELIEGEDLAAKLEGGPLPLAEALEVARQVAEALEAAHTRGIVHRDLKPANVKFAAGGQVKVLDFGLAKALEGAVVDSSAARMHQATTVASATQPGMILGTAAYMSPEQARGREVDRRTDIWAFGCLLFELISGVRPFAGETVSDVVASILKSDPPWEALPPRMPQPLLRLLHRCLEKDPRRRLHDIADARIEIEDLLAGGTPLPATAGAAGGDPADGAGETAVGVASSAGRFRRSWTIPLAAALALAVGLLLGRASVVPPPVSQPVQRLLLDADEFVPRTNTAIAPDGRAFVFPGRADNAVWRLMVRRLDRFETEPLEGTEYAINPFFSPDGRWVVFTRDGVVRKIPADGGPVQTLCEARGEVTGYWGTDGFIYLAGTWTATDGQPAIGRLPESGGELAVLLRTTGPDENFYDPYLLPGGGKLLFTTVQRGERIEALDLASGERKVVAEEGSYPLPLPSGRLVYYENRGDRLLSAPFDSRRAELTGAPSVILDQITVFAASPAGVLIYAPYAIRSDDIVVRVARDGTWSPLLDEPSSWAQPRFSPGGDSLLLRKTASPNCYLWRYDLARQILTRVTFERDSHDPCWSPDGRTLAFCATGERARAVCTMPADGSAPAHALLETDNPQMSVSWSPTGTHIVYTEIAPATGPDLWVVAVNDSAAKPEVFLQTDYAEDHARFSRDGRWIAYTSDESGREEVYLRPFPGSGGKIQVSREGGTGALWSPDGNELFYASGDRMMVVDVTLGEGLQVSAPRLLFEGDFAFERVGNYDIAPDGESFAAVRAAREEAGSAEFYVVTNAFADLPR
jgi:Tol biopolymer transport system component/tRNA A-37 threonylcarbamoyl transferase component Bud32